MNVVMTSQTRKHISQRLSQRLAEATPGFACKIEADTDLGLATLIVEFGNGTYEPIGTVCSISEAREIAADWSARHRNQEVTFKLWARGLGGKINVAACWAV